MVLILLALALAPGFAIAFYIFYKDQHEREPVRLLIKSFLYGIGSVVVTLAISYSLVGGVDFQANTFWDYVIDAFFSCSPRGGVFQVYFCEMAALSQQKFQ
jgi:RsiW-degrading membrane proteinase PrsW (M82 family)